MTSKAETKYSDAEIEDIASCLERSSEPHAGWRKQGADMLRQLRTERNERQTVQADAEPVALPIETAPRDGTIIRLLVQFSENATEDTVEPAWTIGANSSDHNGEADWQFAGWSWEQDCFTSGVGVPVGWLPLHAPQPASQTVRGVVSDEWASVRKVADEIERCAGNNNAAFHRTWARQPRAALEAREAGRTVKIPDGMVIVPRDPTPEMVSAGESIKAVFEGSREYIERSIGWSVATEAWKAMIDAAIAAKEQS